MELGLRNKSIIVTAASGGLGFSIAKMFVEEGANVCLSGRNPERVDNAVQRLSEMAVGSVEG